MVAAIFLLILAFASVAGWYLWVNDFAAETLEVIFPVAGAIVFCFYLGLKGVLIDAPQPISFETTIAALQDTTHGRVVGMPPLAPNFLPFGEYRGAEGITKLPHYKVFQDLNIEAQLRLSEISGEPGILDHLVEYAVVDWFCNPDIEIGFEPSTTILIHSGGIVGHSKGGLVPTHVIDEGTIQNPFLVKRPITVKLPPRAVFRRQGRSPISLQINTRNSSLVVRWAGTTTSNLSEPVGAEAAAVFKAMDLPIGAQGVNLVGYRIRFEFRQSKVSRFSKQAKQEAEWFRHLQQNFLKDFSWEHARTRAIELSAIR